MTSPSECPSLCPHAEILLNRAAAVEMSCTVSIRFKTLVPPVIYFLLQAQIPLVLEYSKVSVCINISLIQYRVSIEPDDDDEGSIIPRPAR